MSAMRSYEMLSPKKRAISESSGIPRQKPPDTLPFCRLLMILLLVFLCITSAACITSGPSVARGPGTSSTGPDSSGLYLYKNIVNRSHRGIALPDTAGSSPESMRSAAIRDAINPKDPVTRDFAVSLIPRSHGGPFNLAQICDLWENVYTRWTYVDDPYGDDYFSPANRTIALGFRGDCDDFAIVVAAMIESVGGRTRIITAKNSTSGHAYPEVYIGNNSEKFGEVAAYIRQRYHVTDVGCHISTDTDGPRYWLNLDWWSTHPGGRFFADDGVRIAYYPDGRWEQIER